MATITENLSLVKPQMDDNVDPLVFANNFEKIDKAYGTILSSLVSVVKGEAVTQEVQPNTYYLITFTPPEVAVGFECCLMNVYTGTVTDVSVNAIGDESARVFSRHTENISVQFTPKWLIYRKSVPVFGQS